MAKNKTAKIEGAAKESTAQTTTEQVKTETVAQEAAPVAEQQAETVTGETVQAEQVKAEAPVVEKVAEAVKAEAAKVETVVTEAAGQVTSFVKGRLEQAQKQIGQLETEAQKALQTLVTRSRESSREVLQKLNVNELREKPAVKELEKKATWVGGEVRQRLTGLQDRMVKVVGGVASQSQVQAINRELDRLTRKIDSMVSPKKPEQQSRQEAPKA
jgi:tetrahydromethanopterin S-methyltransferase subunit G